MNALGLLFVWTALQVSVFCLVGIGLYAMARRRSPAAGAWAAGAALAMAVGISALALSPWPRWWSLDAPESTPRVTFHEDGRQEFTADNTPDDRLQPGMMSGPIEKRAAGDVHAGVAAEARQKPRRGWQAALAQFRGDVSHASAALSRAKWRWPAWVAVAILVGCALALVRLTIAVWVAHRYRTAARAMSDPSILQLLDQVRIQIGCARPIELRETSAICSPSTIGWLRPAIILPADWRSWSAQERKAVLAHEVAHVARGDFAVWLLAQLGVVLHFYNPLVHWLAGRLRLEQEMAADVCGAQLAGGRQFYLTTLAQMALRRDDPPLAWAARPFLPTRGTLMRRVEMLHRQKLLPKLGISHTKRSALAAILLVVGCLVAGLRGPTASQALAAPGQETRATIASNPTAKRDRVRIRHAGARVAVAETAARKLDESRKGFPGTVTDQDVARAWQEVEKAKLALAQAPANNTEVDAAPFNLDYVPDDTIYVLALHPAELVGLKSLASIRAWLGETDMLKPLDLPLGEIEEFKFIAAGNLNAPAKIWSLLVLRSRTPHDWTTLGTYFTGKAEKAIGAGQEYYRAVEQKPGGLRLQSYWLPDDRTIVIAPPDKITGTFSLRGPVNQPAWAGEWQKIARAPAALAITPEALRLFVAAGAAGAPRDDEAGMAFFGGHQVDDKFWVTGTLARRSAGAAREFSKSFEFNLRTLATRMKNRPGIPAVWSQVIDATKIEADGANVRSQTAVDAEMGRSIAKAVGSARAAARRAVSVSTMKQIGIAWYNYHDQNKHFPSAVVMGPDGKTPHSWRVELLPYFEAEKLQELYKQYRLDEPWDSAHNRKLIEGGAEFFGTALETPNGDCCFFMLTGPGTIADPANPAPTIRSITDGTSRTIGFVEAKRSIPWTKPQDIDYDPDKPLPKLGGFFDGGFDVGFMDGSIRFLPDDLDAPTLRALLSARGGERIIFDPQTNVPKVAE